MLVVLLGLLVGGGYGAYAYSQSRYFLKSDDAGHVYLYKGVDLELLGFSLSDKEQDTGFVLAELGDQAEKVQDGFSITRGKALPFLQQACEQVLQSLESQEPVTPFGIGRADQNPLSDTAPPDCAKGP